MDNKIGKANNMRSISFQYSVYWIYQAVCLLYVIMSIYYYAIDQIYIPNIHLADHQNKLINK